MAVMVGIGTIIKDNPLLTTRLEGKEIKSPTAVIVDSNLDIPLNSKVLNTVSERKVIVAACENADKNKKSRLEKLGVNIIETPVSNGKVNLKYLMKKLGSIGIDSVLLEGGGTLNFSCLKDGIVDKVLSFISPKIIGGQSAKTPVEGDGISRIDDAVKIYDMNVVKIGEDVLIEGYMKKGR